jgi:hypothetical protein
LLVAWLLGCGHEAELGEQTAGEGTRAGGEAGNPPVADDDGCVDPDSCSLNAQRFVASLTEPLALQPLYGRCVQDVELSYCECTPERDQAAFDPTRFAWPQVFSANPQAEAEAGCLVWTRLASVAPARRAEPEQCLFGWPDAGSCEAEACAELCRALDQARAPEAAVGYRAELRSTSCVPNQTACLMVFSLEGECYARHGVRGLASQGPFDCDLTDSEILDRAFPGWSVSTPAQD